MKRRVFNQIGFRSLTVGLLASGVSLLWEAEAKAASPSTPSKATSADSLEITVYRDPNCGCCHQWVDYLQTQGFRVSDQVREDMGAIKQKYDVPEELSSCHTALIGGYVIEGHVPAADIRRLLAERPAVIGIAAPGMPVGSPGMEMGDHHDPFNVVAFERTGQTFVFSRYAAI